jgi:hypothetical protein
MKRPPNPRPLTAARARALVQAKRGRGVTFSTLRKGDRFRFWSGALIPAYQRPTYTKMSSNACRDEHGQWFDVSSGTRIEVVPT